MRTAYCPESSTGPCLGLLESPVHAAYAPLPPYHALRAHAHAAPPRRPVSALLFYAAEHRARIKMEAPHLEEMEGVRAEFEALDAEGLAKYEALVQQDVERFRRECEERGIDPDELMSRPARRPDELRR